MDKVKKEEKQSTPDLDRIMQEGRPVFPGTAEPAAGEPGPVIIGHPGQETPPAAAAEPEQSTETAPAAAQPPAGTPAAEGAPPAAPSPAVAPPEPVGKGKESPRGDYRFKTLEDADKAYRLLQGEKTKVELRLKTVETELDGTRAAEERKAAAAEEDKSFLEFATERNGQALAEINDLNPDDPDYTAKAANCWARANLDVRRWNPSGAPSSEGGPAGELKAGAPGETPEKLPPSDAPASEDVLTTRSFVESVLEGAHLGIPKNDPLFWAFAEQSPSVNEDGTPIPTKDQIWWAVERTLNYRRDLAKPRDPAAPAETSVSREAGSPPASPAGPAGALPMGRSGAFRPSGESETVKGPVSLAETLDSVMEMRRL